MQPSYAALGLCLWLAAPPNEGEEEVEEEAHEMQLRLCVTHVEGHRIRSGHLEINKLIDKWRMQINWFN